MRLAQGRDSVAIAALEALVFDAGAWSGEAVHGTLERPGGVGLLLFADGSLVGHALGWMLAGEGELLRIAVHPEHRGNGLGHRLLAAFLDLPAAASAERVFLEVRASNAPARALYASLGFVVVGTRPRYYRDGADAVLYTLTRSPAC